MAVLEFKIDLNPQDSNYWLEEVLFASSIDSTAFAWFLNLQVGIKIMQHSLLHEYTVPKAIRMPTIDIAVKTITVSQMMGYLPAILAYEWRKLTRR